VSVDGATIHVQDVTVDTQERQADTAVRVDLRQQGNGPITEGGPGRQVASIYIPPRTYQDIEGEPQGEEGEDTTIREPAPVDPDSVVVTLWPIQR
jgi:hypothetical protein